MTTARSLAAIYRAAHNKMRNLDGLQPQEAFEELLKYLLFRQSRETTDKRLDIDHIFDLDAEGHVGNAETARTIRRLFGNCLDNFQGSARELWTDRQFRLSDAALLSIHTLFADVDFKDVGFDVRSAALRLFLGPDLRRGLGIYLTPDAVVRAVVEAAAPTHGSVVYDPACGSGTFLLETLRLWRASHPDTPMMRVRGSDINARMLLLAELNLGHMPGVEFDRRVLDALAAPADNAVQWPAPNQADVILTNPPFGVYVEASSIISQQFTTLGRRKTSGKIPSEVLFIEQCLRWLKPGGLLAIIVPRSVVTNESLADARAAIDKLATLRGVITLPPETFASTGTQANTCVLFLRRRLKGESDAETLEVPIVQVTNVGYDSTGRMHPGCELEQAGRDLRESMRSGKAHGLAQLVSLPEAAALLTYGKTSGQRFRPKGAPRLGDLVSLAQTGRTPARSAYTSQGIFALKVGNLTGQGIDWTPRVRNFVDPNAVSDGLLLADGDIVLTSSAHNPKYIAQKTDIVHSIPTFAGGRATFVGEILRLRVKPGVIDPYELLAFLRMPDTKVAIQAMVCGQTAHLRPRDLLELPVPSKPISPKLVELLKQEAELSRQLNLVTAEQRQLVLRAGGGTGPIL